MVTASAGTSTSLRYSRVCGHGGGCAAVVVGERRAVAHIRDFQGEPAEVSPDPCSRMHMACMWMHGGAVALKGQA